MTPEGWSIIIGAIALGVVQVMNARSNRKVITDKLDANAEEVKDKVHTAAIAVKDNLIEAARIQEEDNKKKLDLLQVIHDATNGGWTEAKKKLDAALARIENLENELKDLRNVNYDLRNKH